MISLLQGDCRKTLASLAEKSVQAIITSPPYFGLREYGTEPLVWGGACCEHDHAWGEQQPGHHPGQVPQTKWAKVDAIAEGGRAASGQFCTHEHEWQQVDEYHNHGDATAGPKQQSNNGSVTGRGVVRYGTCACGAWSGSLGLEPTAEMYLEHLVECFRAVRRVLRDDGCLFVNMGDSYSGSGKGPTGHNGIGDQSRRQGFTGGVDPIPTIRQTDLPAKNLMMIPSRLAMALQADGWVLRSMLPWVRRNSMPESVTDRPASAIEYWFLLGKGPHYFWDADAVKTPSRSMRNSDLFWATWQGLMLDDDDEPLALVVNPAGSKLAHYAAFSPKLVEPLIKASTSERGGCPECGSPWVRDTEKGEPVQQHWAPGTQEKIDVAQGSHGTSSVFNTGFVTPKLTSGWRPSCAHSADLVPVPCVVLDPFFGSGTVGLVADRLGRDAIGCELSDSYSGIATDRLVGDSPMFMTVDADCQPEPTQGGLFG